MKSILHLCALAVSLLFVLTAGLRGLVLLSNSEERNEARAHFFLLLASSELDRWYDEAGCFPDDLNVLMCTGDQRAQMGVAEIFGGVLRAPLASLPKSFDALRKGALLDPWGSPWQYETAADGQAMRLLTLGADRAPGGVDGCRDAELTKMDGDTAFTHLDEEPLW